MSRKKTSTLDKEWEQENKRSISNPYDNNDGRKSIAQLDAEWEDTHNKLLMTAAEAYDRQSRQNAAENRNRFVSNVNQNVKNYVDARMNGATGTLQTAPYADRARQYGNAKNNGISSNLTSSLSEIANNKQNSSNVISRRASETKGFIPENQYEDIYNTVENRLKERSIGEKIIDFTQGNGYTDPQTGERISTGKESRIMTILQEEYGMSEREAQNIAKNWRDVEAAENVRKSDEWYAEKQSIYDQMSDEEKNLLADTYKRGTSSNPNSALPGKKQLQDLGYDAEEMYEFYRRKVAREENEEMLTSVENAGTLKNVGQNTLAVGKTLTQPLDLIDQVYSSVSGVPYDTNLAKSTNYKNAVRNETSDRIVEGTGSELLGKGYGIATSMADSAVSIATGPAALPIMAMDAGANAYVDAIDRGAGEGKAAWTALAYGGFEALFEKVSLDHLWAMEKPTAKAGLKSSVINVLAQMGIEGSEEVATSIADTVADRVINGNQSEYQSNVRSYMESGMDESEAKRNAAVDFGKSLAEDFIGGAVSGGVFGTVAETVGTHRYRKIAKSLSNESTEKLYNAAVEAPEGTTANEIVSNKNIEELTEDDKINVMKSLVELSESEPTVKDVLENALLEEGVSKKDASKQADQLIEMMRQGEAVSEEDQQKNENILSNNDAQARVYGNFLSGQYKEQYEGKTSATDAMRSAQEDYIAPKTEKQSMRTAEKVSKDTGISVVRANLKETDTPTAIVGFSDATADATLLRSYDSKNGAKAVAIQDVILPDDVKSIYYNASSLKDTYAANAAVENYKGEAPTLYNLGVTTAYYTGRSGIFSFDEFKKNPKNRTLFSGVGEDTLLQMYYLGQNAAKREQKNKKAVSAAGKPVEERKGATKGNFGGIDKAVQLHAKKTGLDIESKKETEHRANGYFAPSMMKIVLREDANIYQTLMHETNEFADLFNPEGMEKVYDSVIEFMGTERGASYLAQMGRDYLERYRSVNDKETYRDALKELSNDVIGAMFSTDEGIHEYMDWLNNDSGMNVTERKSIIQSILDFFQDLFNSIKDYVDNHNLARNTERILESSEEKLSHIRKQILKEWDAAIENSKSKVAPVQQEEKRFSLDKDGNRVINEMPVDIEEQISKNIELVRNMDAVCTVSDTVFQKGEKRLSEQVLDFFNEMGNNAFNEIIGDVELSKNGIESDIAHGLGRLKAITFKAVPDVISKGLIVDYQKNWKNRGYDTVVIAAPMIVEGESSFDGEYITAVIVIRRGGDNNQRFYVHESISIKKDELLFKTEIPKSRGYLGNSPSSIFNLLQKIVKGKKNVDEGTEKYSLPVDSNGNKLSEEQMEYFKDSVVRDEKGNIKVVYHGSPETFTVFDYKKIGETASAEGYGFYFTDSIEKANMYANGKDKNVLKGYLNIKKPLSYDKLTIKKEEVKKLVKRLDPTGDELLSNYDASGVGYPSKEWYRNALNDTIDALFYNDNDVDLIANIINDMGGDKTLLKTVKEELGYDGVVVDKKYDGFYVYVSFESNQFKNYENTNPTNNEDIRYSLSIDEAWEEVMNGMDNEFVDSSVDFAKGASYSELPSILMEGYTALKNVTVNKREIDAIARNLIRKYKSTYDEETLSQNMQRVFAFMKENRDLQFSDLYRVMKEVAEPMVSKSESYDPVEQEVYRKFLETFKGQTFKVSEDQANYLESMYGEPFHKIAFRFNSRVKLSKTKGIELDSVYEQLREDSGFVMDYATPEEEAYMITEAIEGLRPQPKLMNGMNVMEQSYDVALEMFNQFFEEQAKDNANAEVKKTISELKQKQKLIQEKNELRFKEQVKAIQKREWERRQQQAEYYQEKLEYAAKSKTAAINAKDREAAEKYQKLEESYRKKYNALKEKHSDTIDQLLAKNRITAHTIRENQERAKVKEQIKKNAGSIITYFNQNTDKKHIPEALKKPIADFITSIDFTGPSDSKEASDWADKLRMIKDMLKDREKAVANGIEDIYDEINVYSKDGNDVLKDMESFLNHFSGSSLSEISTSNLKVLNKLLRSLRSTITNTNKLFVNNRTQNAKDLGRETIRELEGKKEKKSHSGIVDGALSIVDAGMMDARSYFYRLGNAGMSIYDEFREAFNERVWKLKEAQEYMQKSTEGIDVRKWTGDKAEIHTFVINGKELKLTTGQVMTIYELCKRGQAMIHMLNGGIKPTKIGNGHNAIERRKALNNLTEFDIDNITSVLTPEQKKVADAMQQFMNDQCKQWGNENTMKLYGYERYNAKNYFPIKVDRNTVDTKDDTQFFSTPNKGFTKKTVEGASNPLIVGDIFDVFTKHVTEMATYSTFSAPILDAMKWFNFRDMDYSGEIAKNNGSVKEEIESVYGNDYLKFFEKLMKDINAESNYDFTNKVQNKLVGNMKAASVGANIRVAIQQPTAIVRAMAVMNPKYLAEGIVSNPTENVRKANEYSAIAQWKSWGYFETSLGKSMKGIITGDASLKEKITEKSMILAQMGDNITWGYLWQACEKEIQDKRPDLKYDSEEFRKAVAKRFDDVIDQTQVVDTVLHRSHIMRNQNGVIQMVTAFMAEPTKSYNLLMNAARDICEKRPGAGQKMARAAVAFTLTSFVNAMAQAIIDAMRDDDDDKKFGEKFLEFWKENFKENMNIFSMIPYVKDILSIRKGYDVSRTDMQGISYLINGAEQLYKWITNPTDSSGYTYREKHTFYQSFKKVLQGTSQLIGVPIYNLIRDTGAFYHTITGDTFGGSVKKRTDRYETIAQAYIADNSEILEEEMNTLLDFGVSEETIQKGVKTQMKSMLQEEEISAEQYEDFLQNEYEMDENEAYFETIHAMYSSQSDMAGVHNAITVTLEKDTPENRKLIVSQVQDAMDHGKTKDKVLSSLRSKYKDQYLELKAQGKAADLQNLLIVALMSAGYTKNEAMTKINSWE